MKNIILATTLSCVICFSFELHAQGDENSQETSEKISESKDPYVKVEDYVLGKSELDLPYAKNAVAYFTGRAVIAHNGDGSPRPSLLSDGSLTEVEFDIGKGIHVSCRLDPSVNEAKFGELQLQFRYTYSIKKDSKVAEDSLDLSRTWFGTQGVKKVPLTEESTSFLVINNRMKINYGK